MPSLLLSLVLVVIVGCRGGKDEADLTTEEATTDRSGSVTLTAEQYAGMRLFMFHCNRCHPAGEKGEGPALNDKNIPRIGIRMQVRLGIGKMPAFNQTEIPKEDLKKIVEFVMWMRPE